jgi:hypothetical protein
MIRVANGQGFWGDWLEALVRLGEGGPIDYLILDYLAEITMSIVKKQKQADPNLGYARDFPPLIAISAIGSHACFCSIITRLQCCEGTSGKLALATSHQ